MRFERFKNGILYKPFAFFQAKNLSVTQPAADSFGVHAVVPGDGFDAVRLHPKVFCHVLVLNNPFSFDFFGGQLFGLTQIRNLCARAIKKPRRFDNC